MTADGDLRPIATAQQPIVIESWSPEYGTPVEGGDPSEVSADEVDTTVEIAGAWHPIGVGSHLPARRVGFVDGIRRIDARLWTGGHQGICASFAAGLVLSDLDLNVAEVADAVVRRAMFCPVGEPGIDTRHGLFGHVPTEDDDPDHLSLALQDAMGTLEIELSQALATDADLVVIDGPLRFKDQLPTAIGYVKTHRATYLRDPELAVVGELAANERTPVFLTRAGWTRYSWYLRLPTEITHPWAGVVRCEAASETGVDGAVGLADMSVASLGRYASTPHKDGRAPQNLFPIAGLERRLRHLLGDGELMLRALRVAIGRK